MGKWVNWGIGIAACVCPVIIKAQPIVPSIDSLRHHVYELASEDYKGRQTGEEGQKMAANYIKHRFLTYGLDPLSGKSFFYPYQIVSKQKDYVVVKNQGNILFWPWHFFFVSNTPQNDTIKTKLIFAGFGSEAELANLDVTGKAVAFIADNPQEAYQTILHIQQLKGTRSFFIIFPDNNRDVEKAWGVEYQMTDNYLPDEWQRLQSEVIKEPWARPTVTDSLNIFYCFPNVLRNMFLLTDKELESIAKENLKSKEASLAYLIQPDLQCLVHYSDSLITKPVENVGGFIKGTDTSHTIVVSAHFDHIGEELGRINYGADDNASGTSVLLEVSRLMAGQTQQGKKPACNVLFMAFSGEEMGLLGSMAFTSQPTIPLEQIVCNINLDMIGRWDKAHTWNKEFVYLLTAGNNHKELYKIGKHKLKLDLPSGFEVSHNPGPKERLAFKYGSDHYSFLTKGVPVAFFFTGLHEDYHTPNDIPEKLNYPNMTTITYMVYQYINQVAAQQQKLFNNGDD
ncbi:MAG TPA: hypothetical protein DCQ26_16700 [Marinilabiliales bacterium]|jgi:hypothetical protein|nr:MAG: hypothetical protein A2W95_01645 [Bacteroidetes bacterium GWA2_40_14]OFZ29575.1 MAG: hypothetical protein A2437_08730 [Bacteroidetes bacterium RIFOXYC2_FULL_40_12]HAN00235.1 hypothetical protein [Marinilabiliales bacterium]HAZ01961.1 hypothetical protein [Marinilabiliales bacterium]HBX86850.1 hypothetical protein [Marinilabiliales bacterium]